MSDSHAPVEHQLGPFAPPKEYSFEPELQGKLPRPIPPELRQGIHGRRQFNAMRGCLLVGLICVASAETALVQSLSWYVLPLTFTRWIGAALLACAGWQYVSAGRDGGPYRYVKEGSPFIARVVQLVCQPTHYVNGAPTTWKVFAAIEHAGPDGGVLQEWTESFDLGNTPQWYTTSFTVGDYVTGLMLAGEAPRLYGFLGLKPGLGVIDRDPTGAEQLRRQLKGIALAFAIVAGLLLFLVHGLRVFPESMDGASFFLGALAAVLAAAVPLHRSMAARAAALTAANEQAIAHALSRGEMLLLDPEHYGPRVHTRWMTAGLAFLGWLGIVYGALCLNALLDRSKPVLNLARIDQMVHTTWNGIFREYKIKYTRIDRSTGRPAGAQCSIMCSAGHLDAFKSRVAVELLGQGFFGWPWVRGLEPIKERPSPEEGAASGGK